MILIHRRTPLKSIAFIDTEIQKHTGKILDIGCIKSDGSTFHANSAADLTRFLNRTEYICGHNIFNHDLKYIHHILDSAGISRSKIIDTLYFSPLLFPARPYHALLKDDKLQTDDINNPLNDSIKARDLFFDAICAKNSRRSKRNSSKCPAWARLKWRSTERRLPG